MGIGITYTLDWDIADEICSYYGKDISTLTDEEVCKLLDVLIADFKYEHW